MKISKEEAHALLQPIYRELKLTTSEEASGWECHGTGTLEDVRQLNKILRKLFRSLLKTQGNTLFREMDALEMGLIEFVSEETIQKVLDGTFIDEEDENFDSYVCDNLAEIIKYFKKEG